MTLILGKGPDIFEIEGIKASCIICNDANAGRSLMVLKRYHLKSYFSQITVRYGDQMNIGLVSRKVVEPHF